LRRELAQGFLAERRSSLTEIAFLLGYSELTAFDRAFRKWTGVTPMEWRRRVEVETRSATTVNRSREG